MIRSIFLLAVFTTPAVFAQQLPDTEGNVQQEQSTEGQSTGSLDDSSPFVNDPAADVLDPFIEGEQPAPTLADELNFRWKLSSGETIDVEKTFRGPWEELTSQLQVRRQGKPASLIQLLPADAESARVVISRRGKTLDGPFASYGEDGKLIALVNYRQGQRDGILMTWDPSHRPLVFAQYKRGKLDGLRCLFTACCESCKSGHLWLVQEWDAGELMRSHVVAAPNSQSKSSLESATAEASTVRGDTIAANDGAHQSVNVVTMDARYDALYESPTSIREAIGLLSDFESRFDRDEDNLKRYVARYYIQERKAIVAHTNAASQANIAWLRQAYPQIPVMSSTSGVVLSGFV